MTAIADKADYVREQMRRPPGRHHCHWPGCQVLVNPALWGCRPHWSRLPMWLRQKIWREFEPGQEVDKTPSGEYITAALLVQRWIRLYEGIKT